MVNKKGHKTFIQWFIVAFTSLFLCCFAMLNTFRYVYADTDIGIVVPGLRASYSNNATWSIAGDGVIVGEAVTTSSGGCNPTYSTTTGTLNLTNSASVSATLEYTSVLSGGGSGSPTGNNIIVELEPGQSVVFTITSKSGAEDTTKLTITVVSYELEEATFTTTFTTSNHGTYTVYSSYTQNTIPVTSDISLTQSTTFNYTLTAIPDDGYSIRAWHIGNNIIQCYTTTYEFCPEANNMVVYPIFGSGTFLVDSTYYYDIDSAITATQSSSSKKIIVAADSIIPSGTHTIESGVTLFVPFNAANTYLINTNLNDNEANSGAGLIPYESPHTITRNTYRTLTLCEGAHLIINGSLNVGGQFYQMCTGPEGNHGLIQMETGSSIAINENGILYAFGGYIKGNGNISVASKGKVYEFMVISDYPGSASTTSNITSGKAFPLQKFSIQNIEVPMTLQNGALEEVFMNIYGTRAGYHTLWIKLFGNTNSYLFNNAGAITKSYLNGKQTVSIDGNASINPLTVKLTTSLASVDLSTSDTSGLPIPYNFVVNVNSGTTTVNENIIFSKGSITNVENGAKINIPSGKNVYVFDSTEDKQSGNYADAQINVNGTIEVRGSLYTSASGADIRSSSGSGRIEYYSNAGTNTSVKWKISNAATDVSISAAKLHNIYGSITNAAQYTNTSEATSGDKFIFCNTEPIWYKSDIFTVTFNDNGGSGIMEPYVHSSEGHYPYQIPSCSFVAPSGYKFDHWNTQADDGGTSYNIGQTIHVSENLVLFAQWVEADCFTITWKNDDGTVLKVDEEVASGTIPVYDGPTPLKNPDNQYIYTFSGWTPNVVEATADAIYTATYTTSVRSYTVTWKNGDSTLETDTNVAYGSQPSYDGNNPTKATFGRYHYAFIGWSENPNSSTGEECENLIVTGTTVYYAIYRQYVIGLFEDNDGYTRLYDINGDWASNVSGMFFYDSTIYEDDGDNECYYLENGVLIKGRGLVAIEVDSVTYLFYVLQDGKLLKTNMGNTFYVAKTNNITVNNIRVEAGLYYFDSEGHMWYGNSLLVGSTEFGVISSENAAIGGGN